MSSEPVVYKEKYLVYRDGRIFSKITNRFLSPRPNEDGYCKVLCAKKLRSVHRIVAECYIPVKHTTETVNHKDGDKANNHVSNLEWCTQKENIQHAVKNGLRADLKGEQIYNTKFKPWQIKAIRLFKDFGYYSNKELASHYKVGISCIKAIGSRQNWAHVK